MRLSLTPWAALAVSLALTVTAAGFVYVTAARRDLARFGHAVENAQDRIEGRFADDVAFLLDTAALVATDPAIDGARFQQYVASSRVLERYPGLQGIACARRFRRTETAAIEQELAAELTRRHAGSQAARPAVWPDAGREERSAILWIEPNDARNQHALGFDMTTEPVRGAAMFRARDQGTPALTGKVTLVQEIDPRHVQAGFLLFVPVFEAGKPVSTVEERRAALRGWVAAVFRADDFFRGIFGHEAPPLDYAVYDGPVLDPAAVLHAAAAPPSGRARRTERQLTLAGRTWTVVYTATPALLQGSGEGVALLALAVGLVFSSAIFLLSRREARARARAEGAAEELREADRRKDEFLAVLGHELRNPLAPMLTAVELQKRGGGGERLDGIIERQTRQLVHLVDDLLDIARITRGKIELRKQPIEVAEALRRATQSLAPVAGQRAIALTVHPPPSEVLVDADPTRFEQIVTNLVSNAIKYTPPGGKVDVSARADGDALELRVHDTGIGIRRELLGEVFKPFVQVPGARDFAGGGLGIGLALVRGLVERHGGKVRAESDGPGKGADFIVRLPGVRLSTPTPLPRATDAQAQRGRVLVVDDNVDAAETLAEALRIDGHEVRVAHDGEQAVREARTFLPAVVLLDIGLPGASGYEVVQRLRGIPELTPALIAALTGFGQESDRRRALESGFDEHLVKPVELAEVRALLRRRLGAA